MSILELKDVGEMYRVKFIAEGQINWEEVWACQDISFSLNKGETLGIIGQNGSGKTTLLKLISGMLIPDRGSINVGGRVSTLMELGAGFNPEFTGRENIIVNARIYGLEDSLLHQAIPEIIAFADLGRFIDAPIKYYSQGMYMRLAFALAIFVNPDILLIDDILAVGDEEAQQKCVKKVFELKEQGKTIIVVSHDMHMIRKLCDRVVLLEKGRIIKDGTPLDIIPYYLETVGDKRGIAVLENMGFRIVFNNGRLVINYLGLPVTKGIDSCAFFYQENTALTFSSFNLNWKIRTLSLDTIIAEGRNQEGLVLQEWVIQIEEGVLKWDVNIQGLPVKRAYVNLFLDPRYEDWVGFYAQGVFPNFAYRSNWQEMDLGYYSGGFLGIRALTADSCPAAVITVLGEANRIRLFNSGYEQEARIGQIDSSNGNISLKIQFHSGDAQLKEDLEQEKRKFLVKEQAERIKQQEWCSISSGVMRLVADMENKALKLFYKNQEITRGDGLHSSFLLNESWYNTSTCQWELKKENEALILRFSWQEGNFIQLWKLYFQDGSLLWEATTEASLESKPESLKFGLCARSAYKSFFCGGQMQNFSKEFSHWQDMPLENKFAQLLGLVMEPELPAVVLENKNKLIGVIQNSDAAANFRVVQLMLPPELLKDGVVGFSTRLIFPENPDFINNYVAQGE